MTALETWEIWQQISNERKDRKPKTRTTPPPPPQKEKKANKPITVDER